MPSAPDPSLPGLLAELSNLEPGLRDRLARCGLRPSRLHELATTLVATPGESAEARRDRRNRLTEDVRGPAPGEILEMPARGSAEADRFRAIGEEAMKRGGLAFALLAGGMATRMGGVVKALVEVFPGQTFLDLRLAENRAASALAGRPVPLWLMTSDPTQEPTEEALRARGAAPHIRTFPQDVGLRLTETGSLFRDANGRPSLYSTGHGDLVDAVRRAGLLRELLGAGGKYVWIANLDNLGATIDPVILGLFVASQRDLLVEVCDKVKGDRGGIPVHAGGYLQVLEEFRLPKAFDASTVGVFNTNTFLIRAEALDTVDVAWSWCEVEKGADGRPAIQFERLLQELTGALHAAYLRVPRDGEGARFLPVKDPDELARRRGEIELVARDRKMITR